MQKPGAEEIVIEHRCRANNAWVQRPQHRVNASTTAMNAGSLTDDY